MSIKSEKAKEIIEKEGRMDFTITAYGIAQRAVIQAESDAETRCRIEDRERAVRAFRGSCIHYRYIRDSHCCTYGTKIKDCKAGANCVKFQNFLKLYDNGQ